MKDNTLAPSAKGEPPSSAHAVIAGMENDVRTVADLASAVVLMMSGYDRAALDCEAQIGAVLRVAYDLHAHAACVREQWDVAFHASVATKGSWA